jgi:hypothetical protein
VVLQLAGGARARVRQLPDRERRAAIRRGLDDIRCEPVRGLDPGAPAFTRLWNQTAVPDSRYSASLGDWGLSARWSPEWLDGTIGLYLPQRDRHPAADGRASPASLRCPRHCTAIGGIVLSPTACIINPR